VRDFLTDFFLDRTFESLKIPLAIPAVDLNRGCEVIFKSGLVFPAVQATIAVPGLFQPVEYGSQRLVDGGILNNLPIDLLRDLGADVTVAINVQFDPLEPESWTGSGKPQFPMPVPEFFNNLYSAGLIMIARLSQAHLEQCPPDILLFPPIPSGITMFLGFQRASEVIAAGERCAREALPEIEKRLA
jgi:NTE family protein